MSLRKLLLLQDVQLSFDETLSQVIHPSQPEMSKRQRLKLLATSLAEHLSETAKHARQETHLAVKGLAVNAALQISHELAVLSGKFEQKAHRLQKSE